MENEAGRYGQRAMMRYFAKKPLSLLQAAVVGLWLVQAHAIDWRHWFRFVGKRGKVKAAEWYDK